MESGKATKNFPPVLTKPRKCKDTFSRAFKFFVPRKVSLVKVLIVEKVLKCRNLSLKLSKIVEDLSENCVSCKLDSFRLNLTSGKSFSPKLDTREKFSCKRHF